MLLISVIALFAGPVLYGLGRNRPVLVAAMDGFLLVAISGLVLVDVIPESVRAGGWLTLAAALLGFLGPALIEGSFHSAAKSAHRIAIIFGLVSLSLHALADGVALASAAGSLPLAVVLHRIPVGLTIWWLLRPGLGTLGAGSVLLLVALATVTGFGFGEVMEPGLSGTAAGFLSALVAGSLLHVVFHRTEFQERSVQGRDRPALKRFVAGLGAVLAVFLLVSELKTQTFAGRPGEVLGFEETFRTLFLESAPPLLLAYVLSGFAAAFLPQGSVRWLNRGRRIWQSGKGMIAGLPLPVCSCGVVPLYRTLSRQGASTSAALAFLIATPELSLDALILSVPLLGLEMTLARLAATASVALLVGWFIGFLWERSAGHSPERADQPAQSPEPVKMRLRAALHYGVEVVDHTAPWILLGLCIAAVLEPGLHADWLRNIPDWAEVPLFGILGMPMYVCASGATPMVAVLLAKGISPGAALAFLLTGPATNVTTFGVVSSVLNRRFALFFGLTTAVLSISAGYVVNSFLEKVHPIALEEASGEPIRALALISLVLVGGLFAASLLRQGPRRFLGQILFQ